MPNTKHFLTNTELLLDKIEKSGLKKKYIAEQIGRSPFGLTLKIENKAEFRVSEIIKLCDILKIDVAERDRIFFNVK